MRNWTAVLPYLACLGPAVAAWRVFDPGYLDTDTADVYNEAATGVYHDWHSPPYVVAMALWLKAGLGFKHLSLTLAVVLSVGVYRLTRAALDVAWPGVPGGVRAALAVAVPYALCFPVTPFAYWLVSPSTHGWSAACAVWLAALCVEAVAAPPGVLPRRRYAAYLFGTAAALAMLRPNMVLVLPALALVVAWLLWPVGKAASACAAVVLCGLPVAVTDVLINRLDFIRWHPEDQVMGLDLVGLCSRIPEARADFPFTDGMLVGDRYKTEYVPGFVDPLFHWHPRTPVKPGYLQWENHRKLQADYAIAVKKYKPELVRLKWDAYMNALDGGAWWGAHSAANNYALEFRPKYAAERKRLNDELLRLGNHETWRWVSGKHVVWIVAGLSLFGLAGVNLVARRNRRAAAFAVGLLVPLALYAAYLPCTVAPFFRYLYPATLCVQAMALGFALGAGPGLAFGVIRRLRPASTPVPTPDVTSDVPRLAA